MGQAFFVGCVLKIRQRHDVEESWSDVLRCRREGFTKINEQLLGFIGSERLIGVGLRHRWGTSRLWRHPIVPEMNPQRAMVIGVLDGVHVGHQALLVRPRRVPGAGGRLPSASQNRAGPHHAPSLDHVADPFSRTQEDRARVIRLDPRSGLLETPALEFIRDLHARHRFSRLVVGEDFSIWARSRGNRDALAGFGASIGL